MNYKVSVTSQPFGFAVVRLSDSAVLVNTTNDVESSTQFNNMIFEDQYIELSNQLISDNPNIYGLGERVHNFRLDPTNKTYTMFNRDQGTPIDRNLYGSHPFYMEIENGKAHGLFMLNSNAMDVVIQPYALTYKMIGGIVDLFVFVGDTPQQVVQQYTTVVGRPHFPPYWALGWHQCRWGYHTLQETMEVVANYSLYSLPLDTMWNDIDYMDAYKDFTLDPVRFPPAQVKAFVDSLHANGQHYIQITDPGILNDTTYETFQAGTQLGVWTLESDGRTPIIGKVWPGFTTFPDFYHPNAYKFWYDQVSQFQSQVGFDGMWIDMNEISSFCTGECGSASTGRRAGFGQFDPDSPPYVPGGTALNTTTLSMSAVDTLGIHYNTHNLYGWSEANVTNVVLENLLGKRSVVISRSTYAGHGRNAAHWLGDNFSSFQDLFYSISGILSMQLFGIPFVGADICGFNGDTTEELCTRWMQLGSFYPFSRNHNSINQRSQEPYAFGPTLLNASRAALNTRYALLPYYYTLFFEAHTLGNTVWRALVFEFPQDPATIYLDRQVMVGSGLLLSPALDQGDTTVSAYFPAGAWYDFYSKAPLAGTSPQWVTLDAPIEKVNVHMRGGVVIPTQRPALTTAAARVLPFQLMVQLDGQGAANGTLYLDDGDGVNNVARQLYTYVQFAAASNRLQSTVVVNGYSPPAGAYLEAVNVCGVSSAVQRVTVNGASVNTFTYNGSISNLNVASLNLAINTAFTISWS